MGDKDISFFEDVIKNIFKKFTKFKIEKELIKLSNNENIIYLFSESVNYLELLKIKKILHKKSANVIGIITFI